MLTHDSYNRRSKTCKLRIIFTYQVQKDKTGVTIYEYKLIYSKTTQYTQFAPWNFNNNLHLAQGFPAQPHPS